MSKKPVLLAILDGFGIAEEGEGNAITEAKTPILHHLVNTYPTIALAASGLAVGLPEGQMGNSEVGHLHIGAGRTVYQSLTKINQAIADQTFFVNQTILSAIEHAQTNHKKLHIIGLLSDGGVHSHINHIFALLDYCAKVNFKQVYIHAILDGRDTKANVAKIFLQQLIAKLDNLKFGEIASLSGRFYAMDRDQRWDRLQSAYDVMVHHKGAKFTDPINYVATEYQADRFDEFIIPAFNQKCDGKIKVGDSVIFANFRPDRAIQLASVLTNPVYASQNLKMTKDLKLYFISMMNYADTVKSQGTIFPFIPLINTLGEWLSKHKLQQLRIAETEKYAHVTYFFDGGKDVEYPGEQRMLIPSVKVQTYDLAPAMSAEAITKKLVTAIESKQFDVMILNFANPDMVGHTGILSATIEAITEIDRCLGLLYEAMKKVNGTLMITADHGNAEIMIDKQGNPNKKHTSQPVPLIICDRNVKLEIEGTLANVAPTLLDLIKLEKPTEMTSKSLIKVNDLSK